MNKVASFLFRLSLGIILSCAPSLSRAALSPGDIAVVAYNGNNSTADFYNEPWAWVALRTIPANTVINFTDTSVDSTGLAATFEGTVSWTLSTPLAQGTIVVWRGTDWSIGTDPNPRRGLGLSNSGENIFAYEGYVDSQTPPYSYQNAQMITGISFGNSGWQMSGSPTTSTSYIPINTLGAPISIAENTALYVDDRQNGYYSGPRSMASKKTWLARLNTPSNWTTRDVNPFDATLWPQHLDVSGSKISLEPIDARAAVGQGASFTVAATGIPPFQKQWLRQTFTGANSVETTIQGATDWSLKIARVSKDDYGVYFVRIADGGGNLLESKHVQLGPPAQVNVPRVSVTKEGKKIYTGFSFTDPVAVDMACITPGAVIHYTRDGTSPDANSPVFTQSLVLTETATIRAIGVKPGLSNSKASLPVVYTKLAEDDSAPGLDMGVLSNNRLLLEGEIGAPVFSQSGPSSTAATALYDRIDHVHFRVPTLQTVHLSVSNMKSAAKVKASVLSEDGTVLATANAYSGVIRFDALTLSAGAYTVRIEYQDFKAKPYITTYTIAISGGKNWRIVSTPTAAGKVQHVGLVTFDGGLPVESSSSWVVIHGRVSSPNEHSIFYLASALNGSEPSVPQILFVDWETGASDNWPADLGVQGSKWISPAAKFIAERLRALGIADARLNLAGHSWGAYMARQIAFDLQDLGQPARLVALDPARLGYANTDQSGSTAYFATAAHWSWAFYGVNNNVVLNKQMPFGNEQKTFTANNSFAVSCPASFDSYELHNAPIYGWAGLVQLRKTDFGNQIANKLFPDSIHGGIWSLNQCRLLSAGKDGPLIAVQRSTSETGSAANSKYKYEGVLFLNNDYSSATLTPLP